MPIPLFATIALLSFTLPVLAQDAIATDRPGLTFTPWLVPPGRFQIELGLPSAAVDRTGGSDFVTWSSPLALRYGFDERLELRLGGPLYSIVDDDRAHTTTEGWNDLELGFKLALCDPAGLAPRSACIAGVRLPTGDADLTVGQPGFSATVVGDWDLGSSRTLRAMAGLSRTPTGSDDALQGNLALLLGRSLDARWSGYGELGWLPSLDHADDQAFAGAGIAFLAGSDLQLDLSADFGLTDDSPDAILACGASWRW